MDLPYDLSQTLKSQPVSRVDRETIKWMNSRKNPGVQKAIDEMGRLSAKVRNLRRPVTSFDKLAESEDEQAIYLLWKPNERNFATSVVMGYLKTSVRKLYLSDATGRQFVTTPLCVLDFFVHPDYERQGYALLLFNNMLEHENIVKVESKCAFDKPSEAMLNFLRKHFSLEAPIWQPTNMVVFPGFFDDLDTVTNSQKANGVENRSSLSARRHPKSSYDGRPSSNITSPDDLINAVPALAFSSNGRKLAVAASDQHVILFDDKLQRRDKFSTKPVDAKYGKKSYAVKCVVFSPDSTKLAVGQTDNIVYVYRLGESWDEKKVICNKFPQSSSVCALIWPEESRLIIGIVDGKVRAGSTNSNKCATLYKTDSMVVSLAQHPNRRSFISGHANGSIIIYSLESRTQTKICVHSTAPYCLALSNFGILAAGADRRIISYSAEHGRILQDFDYASEQDDEKEFYVAVADPTGHNVIFGSFNRFRLMCWNQRRGAWSEDGVLNLCNFYTVTALAWKPDGTTIVAGNSVGGVIHIDCCMKRALLKNRFETTYISPSQIVVTDTKAAGSNSSDGDGSGRLSAREILAINSQHLNGTLGAQLKCVIRSAKNYAITDLRILGGRDGRRNFVVAHTPYTLILADIQNQLCSEIAWDWNGSERFYLENENVCMIVNAGEISFVEYGQDEILGWIRTERVNPHLISVRVTTGTQGALSARHVGDLSARAVKRRFQHGGGNSSSQKGGVCRVAYLLDVHTISILNLVNGAQIGHISHTNSIDWIELNESASKLLFRDVGSSLYLHCVDTESTRCLLNYCSYVQWVPQSDVIVAQSGESLCVWYNSDDFAATALKSATATTSRGVEQNATRFPIQGDIEMVLRDENHTEVIVLENNARVAYELDSAMIEFGTALNDLDLSRALIFLERCEQTQRNSTNLYANIENGANLVYELAPMWQRLAQVALQNGELLIAQRCFAALNDFPKVKFLQETIERAEFALQQQINQSAQHQNHQAQILDGGGGGDYMSASAIANYYEARARIALLNKDFKAAERIYLENNALDEAIEVYKKLNNWEAAIELAKATGFVGLEGLKESYYRTLNATGQHEKAAEVRVNEGDVDAALRLYLDSNRPSMAARLMLDHANLLSDVGLVESVVEALTRHELFDKAGELLEATKQFERAMESFRRGKNFGQAIHVARSARPETVVELEEEWANTLYEDGSFDAAISHYLESGKSVKAADSAILAKEWTKAVEILEVVRDGQSGENDRETISQFYAEIARHFEAEGEYGKAEKFYLDGDRPTEAIEMYNKATRWTDAYKLAAEFFGAAESRDLYAQKAETLERAGRLAEAENLYVSIGEPNRAISMYKEADRFDEMMRLVERYHVDKVEDMHKRLAEELEEKGDFKGAEEHYLASGDWNSAVEMYKEAEQFADAFRVAKFESGGENAVGSAAGRAAKQVAYLWAKSVGGDAAVKLLTRHGLLHDAIDMGTNKGDFEFVFELCNFGAKIRLADVQQKYAEHLEDEGDFVKAEEFYLKAGKGREAVLMHIHNQNWESAEQLASLHSATELLNEVLIARARAALEEKRASEAESFLLRASRPDIILAYYREVGAWTDALRVAAKYAPDALQQVQREYELEQLRAGANGAQLFIKQAAEWERQGEYRRAVDCYLKVDEESADDPKIIVHAQTKAGELIVKFLPEESGERVEEIGMRLMRLRQFSAAAELFLTAKMTERAVEALVEAHEWTKARRVAAELSPIMAEFVETAYRNVLKTQGRVGELADVDVLAAIDLLAERGEWDAALATAKRQNHRPLLDKYLMARVAELMDERQFLDAAQLFLKFGASANPQNFNVYKRIIDVLVNQRNCGYETYATLRDMVHDLNEKIINDAQIDTRIVQVFESYEFILHLYALREALSPFVSPLNNIDDVQDGENDAVAPLDGAEGRATVARLRLWQSIALLRYIDLLQPDKVFYEAGTACREYGKEYENLAFVLLNHYLDIADAIEENDPSLVDNSLFEDTDIPQNYAIPQAMFLGAAEYEEVKEWVLATSVGQNIAKVLKMDGRRHPPCFEASLVDVDNGRSYPVCVISGYPILDDVKELGAGKMADPINWATFSNIARTQRSDEIFDVQQYLLKWTGKE